MKAPLISADFPRTNTQKAGIRRTGVQKSPAISEISHDVPSLRLPLTEQWHPAI